MNKVCEESSKEVGKECMQEKQKGTRKESMQQKQQGTWQEGIGKKSSKKLGKCVRKKSSQELGKKVWKKQKFIKEESMQDVTINWQRIHANKVPTKSSRKYERKVASK